MAKHVKINFINDKKSQIFIFDLIFASIIIIVAIAIILSYYNNNFDNTDLYNYNSQILNGLTEIELNSLNSNEIRQFFKDDKITNIHNTIAQQIIDFYAKNNLIDAKFLTEIYVKDLISKEMSLNITINNGTDEISLYENSFTKVDLDSSVIATSSKRVIIHFINNTQDYKFYTLEVKLWI